MSNLIQSFNGVLLTSKAPNLPIAPVDYSQQYMDQVLNALRLYFNQLDNFAQGVSTPSSGTTANRPINSLQAPIPIGQFYFDTTISTLLVWDGTGWISAIPASASPVTSFSAGVTGLTPNTATTGPVTLAGTLAIANGGTGLSTLGPSGTVLTSNGTSALWAVSVPVGTIHMWATGTAPAGYLLCNGASVSTTTFAALFAVIGYTFGGSGASFLLPNYTNRMPYGTTIGATGGSADAVVVSHTHTGTTNNAGTHNHATNIAYDGTGGGDVSFGQMQFDNPTMIFTQNAGDHNHSFTTDATGSSGTNANLPPYLGINFIIKT
jgi:microcystin-dependent protein